MRKVASQYERKRREAVNAASLRDRNTYLLQRRTGKWSVVMEYGEIVNAFADDEVLRLEVMRPTNMRAKGKYSTRAKKEWK